MTKTPMSTKIIKITLGWVVIYDVHDIDDKGNRVIHTAYLLERAVLGNNCNKPMRYNRRPVALQQAAKFDDICNARIVRIVKKQPKKWTGRLIAATASGEGMIIDNIEGPCPIDTSLGDRVEIKAVKK